MKKLHERKKFKKILFSKVSFVIVLCIVVLLARGVWNSYNKYSQSKKYLDSSQAELQELKQKQKDLKEEISYIQTKVGKDAVIVEKFNVAKEGEYVVVVTDLPQEIATSSKNSLSWWDHIVQSIIGLF